MRHGLRMRLSLGEYVAGALINCIPLGDVFLHNENHNDIAIIAEKVEREVESQTAISIDQPLTRYASRSYECRY